MHQPFVFSGCGLLSVSDHPVGSQPHGAVEFSGLEFKFAGGGFFKSKTCFQGAEISLDKMTCVRLLEMFPVVFERLNSKVLKLSGTSDTSMPHFYDFKWLNDLVDWRKSSLIVLSRHWKQCFLSLLNILQVSCHVNSARIIMDIETLISCDIVSIDDVKDQVLRLSISLSRKSSFTSEMKAVSGS
ncbi:hypothetical protein AAC387_Pa06g2251 [Persea americana]